jgi:hypothetical protein
MSEIYRTATDGESNLRQETKSTMRLVALALYRATLIAIALQKNLAIGNVER